jgi:hypothetical protein
MSAPPIPTTKAKTRQGTLNLRGSVGGMKDGPKSSLLTSKPKPTPNTVKSKYPSTITSKSKETTRQLSLDLKGTRIKPRVPATGSTSAGKALGKVGTLGAVAAAGLTSPPVASGTLTSAMKRGDYKPKQGPAVPARMTQGGLDKGSFNSAFKAFRTAGKKTFSWRGKKYTTKKAGE